MTHPVHTPVVAADGGLVRFALTDLLAGVPGSMRVELTDAGAAEPWLTRLVGEERALDALVSGRVDVPARPELATLALLLWARRWWPASPTLGIPALDPALLDLEAAVATAEVAEGMLDGFEATPADLFDAAVDGLAATPVADEVRGLCTRLSAWFDGQDDVVRAEAAARLAAAVTPGQRAYALAAGIEPAASGEGVVTEGRESVDWARVPPGILDAAENTVTWRVVAAPTATRLEVEVAGAFADATLSAFATRDGEVVAEVPLRWGVGRFAGAVDLAPPVPIGLFVGVTPEDLAGTTAEDRAEVVALVRAREALPPEARTLAERAAADGEF
ncbi:Uncharacterised protein [Amycolatopsis camponoti]|uniref:Uncharacterized protein n=1 Tax=Amycolatopsis camponoti TaxID=2606593 RepID=A0A6I8LZP4_9PSEU|nr:hypothetical protein [Amycolatopsis camponoti]VVJ21115.1 Uncharacterised protein [Amycolatopsis camponoti]